LNNNDKLIIYKNIVIIDGLDIEKEYLENLNIDFLDESINL
jgi:nucleosome binding factor SPN SPT16 subunit